MDQTYTIFHVPLVYDVDVGSGKYLHVVDINLNTSANNVDSSH